MFADLIVGYSVNGGVEKGGFFSYQAKTDGESIIEVDNQENSRISNTSEPKTAKWYSEFFNFAVCRFSDSENNNSM